jgi:hypothetical protein
MVFRRHRGRLQSRRMKSEVLEATRGIRDGHQAEGQVDPEGEAPA